MNNKGGGSIMTTMTQGYRSEYTQEQQLENWAELIAYFRFYPDILCDWLSPTEVDEETGKVRKLGIELGRC